MDLCAIPGGHPPDGVLPNFENPPSLAPAMIAVMTLMSTFSILIVAGRLYVNRTRLHASDCGLYDYQRQMMGLRLTSPRPYVHWTHSIAGDICQLLIKCVNRCLYRINF